jgi:hypothetical protein
MQFDAADLAVLAATDEVDIETRSVDGSIHRTIIWVVVDGADVFVRSYLGERARWYREALARTSAGFQRKYAHAVETPDMVRPEILPTTLRLIPA